MWSCYKLRLKYTKTHNMCDIVKVYLTYIASFS